MTTLEAPWPTKDQYDIAIKNWENTIQDPEICNCGGTLAVDNLGGILYMGGANHFVCVYKIGNWIVRCFCVERRNQEPYDIIHRPPHDIRERYKAIDTFCHTKLSNISALVPITYVKSGITIGKYTWPIVKMQFIDAPNLGEFIAENHLDTRMMHELSNAWFRMTDELEMGHIAHGDLDLTNVLVEQKEYNLKLRLIDYDNLWIETLAFDGQKVRKPTDLGHISFQHPDLLPPSKEKRLYNAEMDRFSAISIYISLKVLSYRPLLYATWDANEEDRLLFSAKDYCEPDGGRILEIRNVGIMEILPYIDALYTSLSTKPCRMPPRLREIVPLNSETMLQIPPPLTIDWSGFTPIGDRLISSQAVLDDIFHTSSKIPITLQKPRSDINPDKSSGRTSKRQKMQPLRTTPDRRRKRVAWIMLIVSCILIIIAIVLWLVLSHIHLNLSGHTLSNHIVQSNFLNVLMTIYNTRINNTMSSSLIKMKIEDPSLLNYIMNVLNFYSIVALILALLALCLLPLLPSASSKIVNALTKEESNTEKSKDILKDEDSTSLIQEKEHIKSGAIIPQVESRSFEQESLGDVYRGLAQGDPKPAISLAIFDQEHTLSLWESLLEIVLQAPIPQGIEDQAKLAWTEALEVKSLEKYVTALILSRWLLKKYKRNSHDFAELLLIQGDAYHFMPSSHRQDNLQMAIACYNGALRVYTIKEPYFWAKTQYRLANIFYELLKGDRQANLEAAIACYLSALKIYKPKSNIYPKLCYSLGNAYRALLNKDQYLLLEAVLWYEKAIHGYHSLSQPIKWATVQNELGITFRELKDYDKSYLNRAIECHRQALRVYKPETNAFEWAKTQYYLGNVYSDLATVATKVEVQKDYLAKAVALYTLALEGFSQENFPLDWASTITCKGLAIYRQAVVEANNSAQGDLLRTAIQCYDSALFVYRRDGFQINWAEIQTERGRVLYYLANSLDKKDNKMREVRIEILNKTIASFEEALEVYQQFQMENQIKDVKEAYEKAKASL